MKKILACLVVICCLFNFVALTANATDSNEVEINVEVYDETVTVDISTNFACGGLQGALEDKLGNLTYDAATVNADINSQNAIGSSVLDSKGKTRFVLVGDIADGTDGNQ